MFTPANATPAAYPRAAAFARAPGYVTGAPPIGGRPGKGRSYRAACIAAGYSMAATLAAMRAAYACHRAGRPLRWPS